VDDGPAFEQPAKMEKFGGAGNLHHRCGIAAAAEVPCDCTIVVARSGKRHGAGITSQVKVGARGL